MAGGGGMFFRFGVWVVVGRGYPRLVKGAGLKVRRSLVRDPVAQAFVGSSPTPRTTTGSGPGDPELADESV